MNENKLSQYERKDIREEALRQARVEMEVEVRREIVDIFGELLDRMWQRLSSLVGDTATAAIFDSARREVTSAHPFLDRVAVDEAGIGLERLRENLTALDRATVRAGFLAFLDNVVSLLTDLTGDILARKVEGLVQEFKQKLEED